MAGEAELSDPGREDLAKAHAVIDQIILRHGSTFSERERPGYRAGVDYYSANGLIFVVANAMFRFKRKFGSYPNLLEPTTFSEKIIWSKFFALQKVPESGNKLSTASFLPDSLRGQVLVPEVVWSSDKAILPKEGIAPGSYYLKVNHGSGMVRHVDFPPGSDDAIKLQMEFSRFLRGHYGKMDGEWWYNVFKKRIFLEKSVSAKGGTVAWCFYVFAGEVKLLVAFQKMSGGDRSSWFDERFNSLDDQNPDRQRADTQGMTLEMLERMSVAACLIGRAMPFVRIDFLIGDDGNIYISELTHSPGNGLTAWPGYINERLGRAWDLGI